MDPDSREQQLKDCFECLDRILKSISDINISAQKQVQDANVIVKKIKVHVDDLLQISGKTSSIACLNLNSLSGWKFLGEGYFGNVFECRHKGSKVAVKTLKDSAKNRFRESDLLRYLSHDNIVGYRGMGYMTEEELNEKLKQKENKGNDYNDNTGLSSSSFTSSTDDSEGDQHMFLVMEFVRKNLFQYVWEMETYERHGLSESQTWNVGQQVASALAYLHSLDVVHRDLKPDNILIEVGPNRIVVKVADFGLAWHSDYGHGSTQTGSFRQSGSSFGTSSSYRLNIRWGAPELADTNEYNLEDYQRGDMYSFGLVLAYTLTGVKALAKISSSNLSSLPSDRISEISPVELPRSLEGVLRTAIEVSVQHDAKLRKSAENILKECFMEDMNPYQIDPTQVEFFSCGFMEKTDIYVADSCTTELNASLGFSESGAQERPVGYNHEDLICRIETETAPYRDLPDRWSEEEISEYQDKLQKYSKMAKKKEIDNNPTAALKGLVLARPGDDEKQTIEFYFKESDYCHHRCMRETWMSLSISEKNSEVPYKGDVHPYFSNSFGLHVAILTNEGPDKPQKFVFPQRARRKGMSSPGNFTCGAVESVSKPDYVQIDGKYYVNLVNTAARGLFEEIGLELTGSDVDAICLTTVYLKFDFHEWGLCGFVDLKDERIAKEHRLSAADLKARFTSGPKDKFEHQTLTFVDFQLEPMLKFVSKNHENFASSAKLVVVKVLEAFFGIQNVQMAFNLDLASK